MEIANNSEHICIPEPWASFKWVQEILIINRIANLYWVFWRWIWGRKNSNNVDIFALIIRKREIHPSSSSYSWSTNCESYMVDRGLTQNPKLGSMTGMEWHNWKIWKAVSATTLATWTCPPDSLTFIFAPKGLGCSIIHLVEMRRVMHIQQEE